MKTSLAVCMFVVLSLASLANAMELETLLSKARAYHGDKLAKIEDMVIEYTGIVNDPSGKAAAINSTLTRAGELWRMDATISMGGEDAKQGQGMSMETVVLYDGKEVWTSVMGMKMKTPKDQAMEKMSFAQYWDEPPVGSTVLGEETVNGRDCYVVEHPKNEFVEHPVKMWIDKEYFVNVQSETYASGKLMKTVFSDFKPADGDYVIPYKSEVFSDGTKMVDVTITKVLVNKGVDTAMFDASKLDGGSMDLDLQKLMKEAGKMKQSK